MVAMPLVAVVVARAVVVPVARLRRSRTGHGGEQHDRRQGQGACRGLRHRSVSFVGFR
jgi:hypothetical protein